MNIVIRKVISEDEIKICQRIRNEVFVKEQGVQVDEDLDGKDSDSDHYLLLLNKIPVGTGRIRFLEDDKIKIERIAILYDHRSKGLGNKLMQYIINDLKKITKEKEIITSAQSYTVSFYKKLGFKEFGDEFLDAGILHKNMKLE